ncbi:MAG: hypothetical protein LBL24_03485 [Bacteroidales bacterium]|jgi:hypothetical protein|nr:hypothetical protein [Bacteroidales bacterium]
MNESLIWYVRGLYLSRQGKHINRKIRPRHRIKTPYGVHIMNLLRRFVDVFCIDSIDMNALTGNVSSSGSNSVGISVEDDMSG